MKRKLLHGLSAAILAIASTTASAQAVDPLSVQVPGSDPASEPCTPTQRTDEYGTSHFNDDVRQSAGKSYDAVLFGDSITDFWVYSNLSFDGNASKTINMGIGSDRVQHLLWRVRNGALDGYATEYFTLLIGVNNGYQKHVDNHSDPCDRAEDVAEGIRLILKEMVEKHPQAKILLMPILPYGFDSRYYPGLDVRTVNEDVNDIIIKFVDYKNVFWVDLRGQYLNPDATCKASVFGGPGGSYDAPGHYLHPHTDSYPAIWKPALTNAMAKYHDAAGGLPHVAEPSVGYASAAQFGYDHAATITVCGILTGTDANAVPVETYSISYKLDGGPWTVALQDQGRALTRASFAIPDVALGAHTCQVKVTTADGKVLDTAVDFTMHDGWTGAPLPSDESAVRTDGTLVCAYACGAYTVNGVPFARANGSIDDENIAWPFGATSGSQAPSSVASGDYRELLNHCWWANAGEKEVTLKNLAPGHDYLVQIFGYRNYDGHDKSHVWIKESYRDANYMKILGEGWTCGGTLTGVFTATGATKTITVCGDNNWAVNGIQVRDLGESGAPVVVRPSIGSVAASVEGSTATISLSGVAMGTDDEGTNATSYAVSYRLDGAAAVQALAGQTAATASFDIANLADGNYTCAVTIRTDKNKTSAEKSISFTVGTPPPEVVAPSIGATSATTSGSTATVSLDNVVMGTDDEGAAAASYAVSYSLTNAPAVTALQNQTAATASFDIANLADGNYTCTVTITTDKGKTAGKTVSFTIDTTPPPPPPTGWTVKLLTSSDTVLQTGGTLLYAYRGASSSLALEGVTFEAGADLSAASIAFVPSFAAANVQSASNTGTLRGLAWNFGSSSGMDDIKLTLSGLTAGHQYLVQILAHNSYGDSNITIGDQPSVSIKPEQFATIYGSITAKGTSHDVVFSMGGAGGGRFVNAVQVRDLGGEGGGGGEEGGEVTVVEPSIGSVSATPSGSTASLFLSGIVMGTDDAGTNATSYSVSYSLDGGAVTTALAGQTGATASFDIGNLADGNHACEVTITTDKGKIATKSVSFAISTSGGSGGSVEAGWTVGPMAADGSTIRTDGTLLYAYSSPGGTVGGVPFTRAVNLGAASMVSASPASAGNSGGGFGDAGATGDFGKMLRDGWYWTGEEVPLSFTLTLSGLTAGRTYLVQLVSHRTSNSTTVSANGSAPVYVHGTHDGVDYTYGASLVGVFTATGATADITVTYPTGTGNRPLNAIQVRELPEGGGGGFQDWPADPDTEITDATTAADLGITAGAFAEAATTAAELRKLAKWASANGVTFGGADVNAMSFDADGNPETALTAAYLLNCAVAGLDEAKAAFRFEGIVPGTVPTIDGSGYNGTVTIYGAAAPTGPWQPATDRHHFYRATLTR